MSLEIGTQIPVGLFNKRLAILAMQGAGKTYTAGVLEEEMLDYILDNDENNAKLLIIDPVGAHWGIREKFPIHIVGGDHGDIEIDYESGQLFARMVSDGNLSMLFDLSKIDQDEALQFTTDFLNELFKITSTPTHIILEEADFFAPQKGVSKLHKFSNAAVDSIVRRGRGRGLGMTMITQRPAVLNKNVLSQVDASIILNINGRNDLKVIEEYLDQSGKDDKEIKDLISKIMGFQKGQGLLFSPAWLKRIDTIRIRPRISFHAGAEPELGKPDPAASVKLIEMTTGPIIPFLNGEIPYNEEVEPDEKVRRNKWMVEDELPEITEYHFGTKRKSLKSFGILGGSILFFWSIMVILS
jgi:hypothetical protein